MSLPLVTGAASPTGMRMRRLAEWALFPSLPKKYNVVVPPCAEITAGVKATVVAHGRHPKVRIFKMRRRKHYQKHQGHRQNYTELHIQAIEA